MNANEEQQIYRDALEEGLLNGASCYRRVDDAIVAMEEAATSGRLLRGLLRIAVPAAALLVAGTAVAAGIILTGKGSKIRFFSDADSPAIQARQDYYERHSDALGDMAHDEQGNMILTVENIAIHRERIAVFYSSSTDLDKYSLTLSVNEGEERAPSGIEQAGSGNDRAYMASFSVFPEVPDDCTLTIRFYNGEGSMISKMTYAVDLSQSEKEETLILSGKTVEIKGTYSEEPEPPYRPYHDHTVTVESVRIDRDGGCITLSEPTPVQGPYTDEAYAQWDQQRTAAKEAFFLQHPGSTDLEWERIGLEAFLKEHPCPLTLEEINALQAAYDAQNEVSWDAFINFSVTDEEGVSFMPLIEYYAGGSGQGRVVNEILFTPREGMKAVKLTPLYYTGQQELVRIMFDQKQQGVQDSEKMELVSYTVDKQTRTVTVSYRLKGVRIMDSYAECLLDRQGQPIYPNAMFEETRFMDASSGIVTTEIQIMDQDWDIDEIGGYAQEWSIPYPDEEKSITVYLEP